MRGVATTAGDEAAPLDRTPVPSIPTAVGPPADSVRMRIEASFCPDVLGWKLTVIAHEAPAAMALPLQVSEMIGNIDGVPDTTKAPWISKG